MNIRQRPIKRTFLDFEEKHGVEWPQGDLWNLDLEEVEDNDRESLEQLRLQDRLAIRTEICLRLGARGYDQGVFWDGHLLGIDSNCPPPEITYVCRESYRVVSRHHTKAFAYPESISGTYFNFDLDTLYIRCYDFAHYFIYRGLDSIIDGLIGNFRLVDQDSLRKVRKLAIMLPCYYEPNEMDEFLDELLSTFEGLKELFLVVRDYNLGWIKHYPPEPDRVGDECIIDALSVPAAIKAYSDYRRDILRGELPELRLPMLSDATKVSIDIERLKRSWVILDKTYNIASRPSVLPKAIVPPRLKKDLDLAERLCRFALENSEVAKTRHNLQAAGWCIDDVLSDDDI